jgi:hypothetical protein
MGVCQNKSLEFVKKLLNNGYKFWNEKDISITRKQFECGWAECKRYLQDRIQQELENTVVSDYPGNHYCSSEKKDILSVKQIEKIIERVFNC